MARLRGLDGDFAGFHITNFPDHHDVRVLPQECFQRNRKSQARPVVDIDLIHAWQVDFYGVFCGRNISADFVQNIETSIERYRLSRTGRTGHENHTVGSANGM